jgi:hypothetical protein
MIQPTVTLNLVATPNPIVKLYGVILRSIIYTSILFLLPLLAFSLMVKALMDLSKLYGNEIKFSSEMYDILDAKLKIFHKMCRMADIQPDHYYEVFPIILKGRTHQFYWSWAVPLPKRG